MIAIWRMGMSVSRVWRHTGRGQCFCCRLWNLLSKPRMRRAPTCPRLLASRYRLELFPAPVELEAGPVIVDGGDFDVDEFAGRQDHRADADFGEVLEIGRGLFRPGDPDHSALREKGIEF